MEEGVRTDGWAGQVVKGESLVDILDVSQHLEYTRVILQADPFSLILKKIRVKE